MKYPVLLFLAAISPFMPAARAQSTGHLAYVTGIYGFTNWAGTTVTNYSRTVTNWIPDFSVVGETNVAAPYQSPWTNGEKNATYLVHPDANPTETWDVRVRERGSVAEAHMAMMQDFAMSMARQPFPSGISNGVSLGDVCYLGYPATAQTAVVFSRNNILLVISTDPTGGSVTNLAAALDQQILGLSLDE